MEQQIAPHAPLKYTPKFWDPAKAYRRYIPNLDAAYIEGAEYARTHGLRTAQAMKKSGIANMAWLTDDQDDFRDDGRLPVSGMNTVVLRVSVRLLNGIFVEYFTDVMFSLDGHADDHVSYSTRWRNEKGQPFDLSVRKASVLALHDRDKAVFQATCFGPDGPVDAGYIQSRCDPKDTVKYWDHLQATKQGSIWVFATHCKLGTDGVNLHPLLQEVLAFMAGARAIVPVPVNKGHLLNTDWFGPLEPCRPDASHPQGQFQRDVVDRMNTMQRVEFSGVAEDFCDKWMKRQVMGHFDGTKFFDKMRFLADGTTPIVPNTQEVADLNAEAKKKGVKFITHDTPFEQAA
jgi:hypothetical protein